MFPFIQILGFNFPTSILFLTLAYFINSFLLSRHLRPTLAFAFVTTLAVSAALGGKLGSLLFEDGVSWSLSSGRMFYGSLSGVILTALIWSWVMPCVARAEVWRTGWI